ncbi:MAG: hypothetical protein A2066_21630 [Bacteroidetes bacterium GWB2_41_8]|nr:MAG: hypothetical protein A2066_21630 [Bacteroidetes bacterium GWB2_41_8]
MERRIALNGNALKKKSNNNISENDFNEKQNSLSSGIRIGLRENFLFVKQKFVNPYPLNIQRIWSFSFRFSYTWL